LGLGKGLDLSFKQAIRIFMGSSQSRVFPRIGFFEGFFAVLSGRRRLGKSARRALWGTIILLLVFYQFFCRRDVFESRGEFLIRGEQFSVTGLGPTIWGTGGSWREKDVLDSFFLSQEAWERVDRKFNLGDYFLQNSRDWILGVRPWSHQEDLWKFYQKSIELDVSRGACVLQLKFRTFDPQKAHAVVAELLRAAEGFVNDLERRTLAERIEAIEKELIGVNQSLHTARQNFLNFQAQHQLLNPELNAGEELRAIARIEGERIRAKIQLRELRAYLAPDASQIREIEQRIASMEAQVREENAKLIGANSGELNVLSFEYIDLKTRLDFLESERLVLLKLAEETRVQANQKQKIFIEISRATLPIEPIGPHRFRDLVNIMLLLLLVYATGRIIRGIIQEHRITSRP
jgi:capsular polysaccharide transport system permease protein